MAEVAVGVDQADDAGLQRGASVHWSAMLVRRPNSKPSKKSASSRPPRRGRLPAAISRLDGIQVPTSRRSRTDHGKHFPLYLKTVRF